jgi:hypothetical protein
MPGASFGCVLTMILLRASWRCPRRWTCRHAQPPWCGRRLDDLQARKVLVDRGDFALERVELFLLLGIEGLTLLRSAVHDRLLAIGLHTALGGEGAICSA